MKRTCQLYLFLACLFVCGATASAQTVPGFDIQQNFLNPPATAKPWVFWYWMQAAVSKEGITADLEAMKEVGIGGAYLMPIKDSSSGLPFQPTARQLSPEWWQLVQFAMQEARRLHLQLAMHVSDGFALAGGPWITPELSMQKLVWTKTYTNGGNTKSIHLTQPDANENYYRDIAVFAYPANCDYALSDEVLVPTVTASNGTKPSFLSFVSDGKESFRSDTACWIQYKYPKPFTVRSIRIRVGGNNYQSHRLMIQASDDGENFKSVTRLEPPRHGWQDTDEDVTHAIPTTTARYFRFVYDKSGSEPGAEDLDAAKWKPAFKVIGIYLSDEPTINQYESKNGSVWRISRNTTTQQVPDSLAVPLKDIINLTRKMDAQGHLNWKAPGGKKGWVIVRIGHTSTGHTNATGGAGKGLECDKFNAAAIQLQFDNWFAKAFEKTGAVLPKQVLKIFHVDSWECGSQNWSTVFPKEFKKRRGYDMMLYLLAMTGVPVENAAASEKFLHDVRQTIAELINDVFYATLKKRAHEKGCSFSAESVAPTMVSDGMLHQKNVDIPMGEFWLNSPTHDKPNDMLDAISAAHIYGKNVVQAEAFTSVRMNWGEHPGNLKVIGDRNFALGINKMVLHVFTHNPWMHRKPGMTLDGIGLYFQRDQTWFRQSKAWIDYLTRCQALLQTGQPVVDIAVFTGEEVPRRSLLPDRLVSTLPGIFGKEKVEAEKKRLANEGQPLRQLPDGVTHSANMADPEDWIDPLNGYAYDSFNPDALMMATVKNGRIVLPGGASYALLVIPGEHKMNPNSKLMSLPVAKKIAQLVKDGATVLMNKEYEASNSLRQNDDSIRSIINRLNTAVGKKGKVILTPYLDPGFSSVGLERDVEVVNNKHVIAWQHRKAKGWDIYFISNQEDNDNRVQLSIRHTNTEVEIWDPVTLGIHDYNGMLQDGRVMVDMLMAANQSLFVMIRDLPVKMEGARRAAKSMNKTIPFRQDWKVQFDPQYGGPRQPVPFPRLTSWSSHSDSAIRYYSGTAEYSNSFNLEKTDTQQRVSIRLDAIYDIATVKVNGVDCGTLWTRPYMLDISDAARDGVNTITITVSNTWHNRLIGDQAVPAEKRITWTTAPFRLANKPLLPAGLTGDIVVTGTLLY